MIKSLWRQVNTSWQERVNFGLIFIFPFCGYIAWAETSNIFYVVPWAGCFLFSLITVSTRGLTADLNKAHLAYEKTLIEASDLYKELADRLIAEKKEKASDPSN